MKKAEALAHFLNKNLPFYHFEIVRVPPSQWHSFVEYLVMKLWHPKQYLYFHRFSSKVNDVISKIAEVNDSMTKDIKYKPWEDDHIINISPSSSKLSIHDGNTNGSMIQNQEVNSSNISLNKENGDNPLAQEENKSDAINISIDTIQQTIIITSQNSPELSNNNQHMKGDMESNKGSLSLFSFDDSNKDGIYHCRYIYIYIYIYLFF